MTHPIRSIRIEHSWDGTPVPSAHWIDLQIAFSDLAIEVHIDAPFYGDPPEPLSAVGPTDKLWEHEVVEVFLLGQDGRYTEIELAPSGHHLVLQLHGVRNVVATRLPIEFSAVKTEKRWTGKAVIPVALIPDGPLYGNATAIHGSGVDRSYLSWVPLDGPEPDFHQPDRFRLLF